MTRENATAPSHTFEDHTGELRVRVRARSLAELFEEAARALAEVMAEGEDPDGEPGPPFAPERISLEARDREALLVDWLNELIFRAEIGKKLYTGVQIDLIDGRALSAEVWGRAAKTARTFVKAATFHGLRISEGPDGATATVLFDI